LPLGTLRDAAYWADLSLAGAPDGRARLRAAIDELAADGTLVLPRTPGGWDGSITPPLPIWVTRSRGPVAARAAPGLPRTWHARLGWAASGRWTATEARVLSAVNAMLRGGGPARVVPLQERSLELTGEEKLLGSMLRGPLFAPGRLTLEVLGAVRASPPFVFSRIGPGPVALVAENSATYHTLAAEARGSDLIGLVAFGGGNGFSRSVEFFAELAEAGALDGPITAIRYFGDLDADGLRIPASASRFAVELGLPPVLPAVGLYRRLLGLGHRAPAERVAASDATTLAAFLPPVLAAPVAEMLVAGNRMAQEAVGGDALAGDTSWATADDLDVVALPPAKEGA
jgi:hypothetical protein